VKEWNLPIFILLMHPYLCIFLNFYIDINIRYNPSKGRLFDSKIVFSNMTTSQFQLVYLIYILMVFLFLIITKKRKALFHRKTESSFFHINPEILVNLFNLIYYLILTPTLTPQLSPKRNRKPQIKCARINIAHYSFPLF